MTAILLFAKCCPVILIAAIIAAALRGKSAAVRHLVWLTALLIALLLPLGSLLPSMSLNMPITINSSAIGSPYVTPSVSASALRWLPAVWIAGTLFLLVRLLTSVLFAVRLIRS